MRIGVPSLLEPSVLPVRTTLQKLRRIAAYLGPGFFVTVGFIDPGNWATNIAAGSEHGYKLLWVVVLSTALLILWQHMAAHLGIVTGKCLAEAIPAHLGKLAAGVFGSTAMAACSATALAEVLGAALGLQILFHIPIRMGFVLSAVFVAIVILLQRYNAMEKMIVGFVSAIGLCYLVEVFLVGPDWGAAAVGFVLPSLDSTSIVIAMGVLGAVVMPHNLYLHSEVVQNRQWQGKSEAETRRLLRYEFVDTLLAMLVGMAINSAMILVAAAVFHRNGIHVNDLLQASATLEPLAGKMAKMVFGTALLFAGISSLITGTVAGGTVFSGFLGKQTEIGSKWFRIGLALTLTSAVVPALLVRNVFQALVVSQVCLSVQLPLTLLPLFLLTTSKRVMGAYANRTFENTLMAVSGLTIVALNVLLLSHLMGWSL